METLYRKVAVSERKPKEGWVLTPNGGILFIDNKWKCPHSGQEQASSLFAHWLEPIKSDNTQTLANTLEQIKKLEADKAELLSILKGLVSDVGNLIGEHDIEWQQAGYFESAKELIQKHKQ